MSRRTVVRHMFNGGITPEQSNLLRVLCEGKKCSVRVHGHQTPADLNLQNGDRVDVGLVCVGPPIYPTAEEVFNTQEGALSYYQLEVRRLRNELYYLQTGRPLPTDGHHHHQQQQHAAQVANLYQLYGGSPLQMAFAAVVQQNTQLAKENKQLLCSSNAQLLHRATKAEGLRNSDLEKIKKLTRALAREKQQAAREAQRAKLRSSGVPALAAAPAQPRTPAARELRGLGVAVR